MGKMLCRFALLITVLTLLAAGIANAGKPEMDFVAKVEKTLNGGDSKFFDSRVDYDLIIDKALDGVEVKKDVKESFAKGAKSKGREMSLGKQILSTMGDSGSYHFLRFVRQGKEERAIFRLLQGGGGVNYHGLVLGKNKAGEVIITDFYNFMSSEALSETLRRTFIMAISGVQQGSVVSIFTKEGDFVRNLNKIKEMQALGAKKKYAEALKIYNGLPASLQKDKGILLLKIIYSAEVDEKQYEQGMDLYKKTFPGDASLDLVTLDSLVLKKKYRDAIGNIDRLDKSVGGDPYLAVLRANMYTMEGNNKQAKEWAAKAIKEEPTLKDAYWLLVSISLDEKNYKETSRLLTLVENDLGIGLSDLKGIKEYSGFVASAEYPKWMKARGK